MKNKLNAKTKSEKKKQKKTPEKLKNRNKLIFFLRIFFSCWTKTAIVIVHLLI